MAVFLLALVCRLNAYAEVETWDWAAVSSPTTLLFAAETSGQPSIVWEDVSGRGEPVTHAVIGGLRLGSRILSGSVFTLHPDRLGEWTYDFGLRRLPDHVRDLGTDGQRRFVDTTFPFNKRLNDPAEPIRNVRIALGQLQLGFRRNGIRHIRYPLDFGPDFVAVGLRLDVCGQHPDGTGSGSSSEWMRGDTQGVYRLELVVSKDPAMRSVIATQAQEIRTEADLRAFTVPIPEQSRFFVTLLQTRGEIGYFAGGGMKVFLRHVGNHWPILARGSNALVYAESGATPGRRRIRLSRGEAVPWLGFSGDLAGLALTATGCRVEKVTNNLSRDAVVNGAGFLRITDDGGPRAWSLRLQLPESQRDLSGIQALRLTCRIPTWCGRVQVDGHAVQADVPHRHRLPFGASPLIRVTDEPVSEWRHYVQTLPPDAERRREVHEIVLRSWGEEWKMEHAEPFCIEIGNIEWLPFAADERARADRQRQAGATRRDATLNSPVFRRLEATPLPRGPLPDPRRLLIRGVYKVPLFDDCGWRDSMGCRDDWHCREILLDDLKAHHLNATLVSIYGGGPDVDNCLKLAHEKGIWVWGQFTAFNRLPKREHVAPAVWEAAWQAQLAQWHRVLQRYRDVPSLLAWTPGEEAPAWQLPYLAEMRRAMVERKAQPYIFLHNNAGVLRQDVRTEPLPAGVAMDCYIFRILHTRKETYLASLKETFEGAKQCGGVAWFVPQLEDGHFWGGWRRLTAADMRFQVWTALAFNIKGFFAYHYAAAKHADFSDSSAYTHFANEMARLAACEKLLVAIERDDTLQLLERVGDDEILTGMFADREAPEMRFALVVNLDTEAAKTVRLQPLRPGDTLHHVHVPDRVTRVVALGREGAITLAPGDGAIVFVGSPGDAGSIRSRYLE